jgi:hypothetical protein
MPSLIYVKSTLTIHPTRLVKLVTVYQQNLKQVNFGSILLRLNEACSGLLMFQIMIPSGYSCLTFSFVLGLILVLP